MKAKGIIVYTVGFQLDNKLGQDALAPLRDVAVALLDAKDGEALRVSLEDIRHQIDTAQTVALSPPAA